MNKFGMLITSPGELIKAVAIRKLAEEDASVDNLVKKLTASLLKFVLNEKDF